MMKSASDQVEVRVTMSPEEMDTFVFCLASKKSAARLAKEMTDLVGLLRWWAGLGRYRAMPGTYTDRSAE